MPLPIVIESRRKKPATLAKLYPATLLADVTSKGPEPWVRFSPFFPHDGIPIPNTPDQVAASVEGLWQGLKVFEEEDVDTSKWAITTMRDIKRSGKSRGAVRGHRFGVGGAALLGYRDARYRIYLPAYRWVLEHRLAREIELLRTELRARPVVLLDYETNEDVDDLSCPLSHAALVKHFLSGTWPEPLTNR
jgi:hypothetical protein